MKKLLFIAALLISMNVLSYRYLQMMLREQKPYPFNLNKQSFIYRKKDIIVENKDDIMIDEYFGFISFTEPSYRYEINDETVDIYLDGKRFSYPYSIREPEIIEVEKVVTVEVPVYVAGAQTSVDSSAAQNVPNTYFHINSSSYSFPAGSDLNQIISAIRNAVDSSEEITIDFSALNPNVCGSYPVYFITDSNSAVITVNIV